MAPNLLVATQTLFSPHRWFARKKSDEPKPTRKTEHWTSPVPGLYEHIPGRGWYLVSAETTTTNPDSTTTTKLEKLPRPQPVQYSKVLHRYLLAPDYESRKKAGEYLDPTTGKPKSGTFFRLDDGVAYVLCWDVEGNFIPGPWERWCVDKETSRFRKMLKGDDPEWVSRRSSRVASVAGSNSRPGSSAARREGSYCASCGGRASLSVPSTRPASTRDPSVLESPAGEPVTPGQTFTPRELQKRLTELGET